MEADMAKNLVRRLAVALVMLGAVSGVPALAAESVLVYTLAREGASFETSLVVEEAVRAIASVSGVSPLDAAEVELRLFGSEGANGACGTNTRCLRAAGRTAGVRTVVFGTVMQVGAELSARLGR